jgi:hypothetical protein
LPRRAHATNVRPVKRLRGAILVGSTVLALGLAACASEDLRPKAAVGHAQSAPQPSLRELPGPPGLPAAVVAKATSLDAKTAYASRGTSALFVFEQGDHLFARAISEGPVAAKELIDLGAHGSLAGITLKPRGDGWVLFKDERVDQNHVFTVVKLDASGNPEGAPFLLPPVAEGNVSYADVALVGPGAVIIYEVARGERVGVFAAPLTAALDGVAGPTRPITEDALAWDLAATKARLGLVVVRAPASAAPRAKGEVGPALGTIELVTLDDKADVGAPLTIEPRPRAQIDASVATIGDAFVVAWTEQEGDDAAVRVAAVSGGKLVGPPALVGPPVGDQALVTLVSDPLGRAPRALLAWENVGQGSGSARIVQLATVAPDGTVGRERARVLLDADSGPDLVADGDGFAVLTLAPARLSDAPDADDAPSWPTALRFGPDLKIRSAEPVRLPQAQALEGVPDLAFGLACEGGTCAALAADVGPPVTYFNVGLPERATTWRAPAWRQDDERPPRVLSLRTVADGPRLARARSSEVGDRTLVAWVTYFLEGTTPVDAAPRGEPPFAATLALRSVGAGADDETVVISKRALSPGGVSIAAASGRPEAVVAWVAGDKTGPQVYATKIDAHGKKVAQKRVTTVDRPKPKKGDPPAESLAANVAIAFSPAPEAKKGEARAGNDGYVVAWVDGRDGNGEVYAARLNRDLEKVVVDKRLTKAGGDASDVSILVKGDDAFVVFADARDNGSSDIYLAHLDAATLRVVDSDVRVYASAGPSRAPELVTAGKTVLLAWLEEPATGDTQPTTLRIAEVDPTGRLVGAPRIVRAPEGGTVTGFSLTCGEGVATCKGSLTWARAAGRPEAGGFTLDASGTATEVVAFGTLSSGPFADPSMSFADRAGKSLFFVEDTSTDRGRIRSVGLGW